jgi:hypothetical protein
MSADSAREWAHEERASKAYEASLKAKPVAKTVTAAFVLFLLGSVSVCSGGRVALAFGFPAHV